MSGPYLDAAGMAHARAAGEPRIVCLVPSITELLCDLGLTGQIVGRTGFCIHPWDTVRSIPKVGGTKDVKLDRVRELAPTHVVVNVDENTRETAEAVAEFAEVVVTHPIEPADNLDLYRLLGGIFDREAQAQTLCARFEKGLARLQAADPPRQEVAYLIWRDPWMTVASDTYIAHTLALAGWHNIALDGVERYPTVELAALAGRVDRVLLSSEPFHFKQSHIAEVEALVPGAEVTLIDGEMTSWYGSRAIAGLDYLASYAGLDVGRVDSSEAERRRIESPCAGVCVIDEDTGLCEGCLRTLEEVALWGSSSADQRREILRAIEGRRGAQSAGA